jgi:hypothetical protein
MQTADELRFFLPSFTPTSCTTVSNKAWGGPDLRIPLGCFLLGSLMLADSPSRPRKTSASRQVEDGPRRSGAEHGLLDSWCRCLQNPSFYDGVPDGFQEKPTNTDARELLLAGGTVDAFGELERVWLWCLWK